MEIKNLNFHINFECIEDLKKALSTGCFDDLECIANNMGIQQMQTITEQQEPLKQAVG